VLRYRRLRSFNVTELDTNRKSVGDFLLVFHCNYMPVFYRFRHITKVYGFLSPFSSTPETQSTKVGTNKLECLG